jgi:hypothetical protein
MCKCSRKHAELFILTFLTITKVMIWRSNLNHPRGWQDLSSFLRSVEFYCCTYFTEEIGSYLRSELNSIEKFDLYLTFDVPRSGKDGHFHIHGTYPWTSIWTRVRAIYSPIQPYPFGPNVGLSIGFALHNKRTHFWSFTTYGNKSHVPFLYCVVSLVPN